MSVETDNTGQDPRVTSKLSLPERMAEHRSSTTARLAVILCGECAANHRVYSEIAKKLAADVEALGRANFATICEIETRCAPRERALQQLDAVLVALIISHYR